jgi:NADH-quinone oxidoreductase subunit E
MSNQLDTLPANNPLANPDKKKIIDEILENNKNIPGATMVVLNELQSQIGFVSEPMQAYVAQKLHVSLSRVHGVISFYSFFTTEPRGKHTLKFCMGTACYVGGAEQLIDKSKQLLGVKPGQTTKDGNITVEICRCVGACSQAPVITLDEEIFGRMRPNKLPQVINSVQQADNKEKVA